MTSDRSQLKHKSADTNNARNLSPKRCRETALYWNTQEMFKFGRSISESQRPDAPRFRWGFEKSSGQRDLNLRPLRPERVILEF